MNNKVTYRQQYTRCGKQRCRKCKEGTGHGPYWYAYWSEKGRTVSKYIGSHLPDDIAPLSSPPTPPNETPQGTAQTQAATPILHIYLLGQFRIERRNGAEWSPIDSRAWHRRRARALLGCLLSSPGRRLGREQVMELLWPDLDVDVAANRLNGAVHELRQILEPEISRPAASRLLRLERDILELADNTLMWVDAETFEALLKEANTSSNPEHTERLLEEAHTLYKGSYLLEELYSEWAAPRRDALQRAWVGLLLDLANVRVEQGAYSSAIETLDRLRTAEPTNETALQRLMALLTQLDRRGEALQVYRQHATMLQRDYESEPLPETSELYDALRKGHIPAIITSPPLAQRIIAASDKPEMPNAEAIQDDTIAALQQPSPFIRPLFQIGRHNQSPLIGRQHELASMQQVVLSVEDLRKGLDHKTRHERVIASSTGSRVPHFLLVRGEAGIGKTRLAEEVSLEAYDRGWAVAWSRSYEQEGTIPYRPWTELLRTLLGGNTNQTDLSNIAYLVEDTQSLTPLPLRLQRLIALLPELTNHPTLSPLHISSPLPYEQERLHLWEATLWLLETLSSSQPLLLVLDDLHWSDDSSIDLLTYLTHHLHQQPILLVATCRDGELPPQHKLRTLIADLCREQASATIALQPLTSSQIGTLLAHLPGDIIANIQTQSAGNPFFAEELARYIKSTHNTNATAALLFRDASSTGFPSGPSTAQSLRSSTAQQRLLPEAIAAVLERRMSRLSNDCHTLLSKAAVLGGTFELRQLLPMASEYGEDTLLDLLEEALQAGLLTEEGTGAHITYFFWHPLIISHLYDRLSAARRAQLHRKAAEAIKATQMTYASSPPEKIAAAIVYHLSKGGGDMAQIAYYAELAGNQAYTLAAYAEVQQYYLQAIQAIVGRDLLTAELPEPRTQLPLVCAYLASTPFLPHPLHICRLLELIAACSTLLGNSQEARQVYECILQLRTTETFTAQAYPLEMNTDERIAQEAQIQALLWREIGNTWTSTSDYPRAHECYLQGKEIMHTAGITSGPAWACLHLQYGALLRLEGNYVEARRYLEEALHILENYVQHATPEQISLSSMHANNALPTRIERALSGDPLEIGYAHERLGIVIASVGQLNEALQHFHLALTIFERGELVSEICRINGNLGVAYATKGDQRTGRAYMQRALNLAERNSDLPNMAFILGNLGDMAQCSGNLLEAERWFKRSLEFAERIHDRERISWFHVELARVQQDLGNLPEATASLHRALITARSIHSSRCIGYALVGLGNLRIVEALSSSQPLSLSTIITTRSSSCYRRLLLRAKSTLQHAVLRDGLEVESFIEGKYLLATLHLILNELDLAYEIALQILKKSQENELTRMIGRINRLVGHIRSAQGYYAEADHYFQQALEICRVHEMRLDYARVLYGCGLSLLSRSSYGRILHPHPQGSESYQSNTDIYQKGRQLLEDANAIFVECHAQTDLTWLKQTVAACEALSISKA